eukprot:405229_1
MSWLSTYCSGELPYGFEEIYDFFKHGGLNNSGLSGRIGIYFGLNNKWILPFTSTKKCNHNVQQIINHCLFIGILHNINEIKYSICEFCALKLIVNVCKFIAVNLNGFQLSCCNTPIIGITVITEYHISVSYRLLYIVKDFWIKVFDQINDCLLCDMASEGVYFQTLNFSYFMRSVSFLKYKHIKYILKTWDFPHCFETFWNHYWIFVNKVRKHMNVSMNKAWKLMDNLTDNYGLIIKELGYELRWSIVVFCFIYERICYYAIKYKCNHCNKAVNDSKHILESKTRDVISIINQCCDYRNVEPKRKYDLMRQLLIECESDEPDRFNTKVKELFLHSQICGYCYKSKVNLKICKGCRIVSYCNKSCQKRDWNMNNHRLLCKKII